MATTSESVIKEVACKACGDPIPASARKCRHCQSYQTVWVFAKDSPLLMAIWLVLFVGFVGWQMNWMKDRREPYGKHAGELTVESSSIDVAMQDRVNYVSCLGNIRNNGEIPWEDVQFEVQCFDKGGKLIDTVAERAWRLTVPARAMVAFRVRDVAHRAKEDYFSHKVVIRWAGDARSRF